MKDLLGNEVTPEEFYRMYGPENQAKLKYVPRGYAARPGTGPAGETCRTCAHACYHEMGKRYWKCRVIQHRWTCGPGTDIRLKSPACEFWKGRMKNEEGGETKGIADR